jgi:hypothetical protein
MAAAEVDLGYLSAHAGVPETDLNTVVTAPTVDIVTSVLAAIVTKLRDLEQEKFQLGVELEGAFRGAESRCEQFKATADKALKEVEELRQKLQSEGKAPAFSLFRRLNWSSNFLILSRNCPPFSRKRAPNSQILKDDIGFRD